MLELQLESKDEQLKQSLAKIESLTNEKEEIMKTVTNLNDKYKENKQKEYNSKVKEKRK
jgi:uncharacterized protein (UPF0335 family)